MNLPEPLTLDVCPQLARGEEPFATIMAAADRLAPGQPLRLLVPFRPAPLFNVMAKRGFHAKENRRDDGIWEVLFIPQTPVEPAAAATGAATDAVFWPDPVRQIDLCGLPPPEPMSRVLETISKLEIGEVLFALLDREPLFLFPELAKRGHEWAGNLSEKGDVYRLLVRAGGQE